MRCNWQRWLWGLIPLVMVSWVAIQLERESIRQDLTERAKAALMASGSPWAGVDINGRDAVLTGRAIQDNEPPRAEETVRQIWGVREVENRAILPPKIEPFNWSARRRGNRIRLAGYVPDRATRQTVLGLTKAAMPGLEVVDRMHTARGVPAPDTWLAGLSFALKQLSLLRQGDARFDDLALTISGEAEDTAAFKAVNAALKSGLPKGTRLSSAQITGPAVSPYTWSAQFAGGQLVLGGHVPGGEKGRSDLLAAAKVAAPTVNIVDRMEPGEGAPQGWSNAVIALVKELVRLDSGTADMKDAALSVGGIAPDEGQAQSIRTALRASVPTAFTLVDQIKVRVVKAPEPAPIAPTPPQPSQQTEPAPQVSPDSPRTATVPAPKSTVEPIPEAPAPATPPAPTEPPAKQAAPAPLPPPEPAPTPVAPAPQPPLDPAPKKATPAQQPTLPEPAPKVAAAPPQPTPPTPEKKAAPAPPPPAEPAPRQAVPAPQPITPEPAPKTAIAPSQPPPAPVPPEVTACQANLNKITNAGHINFATNSATLDSESFATLDRLAAAAKVCPGMRIAIEGHTDAEGSAEYNQRLSVRRARAVVAYLVKSGADRKQLEAVGYGLSRPAAPNDNEENMAKNRRIEFSVRQQ